MNNKKRIAVLCMIVASILLCTAVYAAPSDIKDVPPGHWAYSAVRTLVSKGYLTVGADGAFRGNDPVDRYTFASVLAEILEQIESGQVRPSGEDVQLLRKLTDEYRAELVQYYATQDRLARSVEAADKRFSTLDEKINEALIAFSDLSSRTDMLQKQVASNTAENTALSSQTRELQRDIDDVGQNLLAMDAALSARIQQTHGTLNRRIDDQAATLTVELDAVRKEAQALASRVSLEEAQKRQSLADSLGSRLDTTELRLQEQTIQLQALDAYVTQDMADLENQIQAQANRLNELRAQLYQLEQDAKACAAHLDSVESKLVNRIAATEKDQAQFATELASLQQQTANLTTHVDDESNRLRSDFQTELESKIATLQMELMQTGEASTEQLQAVNKNITGQIGDLENRLNLAQVARYDNLMSKLDEKTEALRTTDELTSSRLQSLENAHKDLANAHTAHLDEAARRQQDVDNALASMESRLTSRISTTEQNQIQFKTELASQRKYLERLDSDGAMLSSSLQSLQQQTADLTTHVDDENNRLRQDFKTELESKITTLQMELMQTGEASTEQLQAVNQKIGDLENRLNLDQVARYDNLMSKLDEKTEALRTADELTSSRLQSLENAHKGLADSYTAHLDEAARQQQDLKTAVASIESRLSQQGQDASAQLSSQEVSLRAAIASANDALASELRNEMDRNAGTLRSELNALDTKTDDSLQTLAETLRAEMVRNDAAVAEKVDTAVTALDQSLRAEMTTQGSLLTDVSDDVSKLQKTVNIHSENLAIQESNMQDTLSEMKRMQSKYGEEIAELRKENKDQAAQFQQALAAVVASFQGQMEALQTELAQTQRELDHVNAKLLTAESRLGLSDEQLAELDRRIQEGLADHLNTALARERAMEKDIADLKEQQQSIEDKVGKDIKKTQTQTWGAAALAAILGVFVSP